MASSIDSYTLSWDYHAANFPVSLMDLLKRKEFVDVTLVADGNFFSAHRLILSALSPYFQKMFSQMPANQQAFVFLKDFPKETVEELIKFIYTGTAEVKYENLENFLSAAKALDIKELCDTNCAQTSNDVQQSKSDFHAATHNDKQYQSTHTIHVSTPAKVEQDLDQPMNTEFDGHYTDVDDYYRSDADNMQPLDQEFGVQDDPWNLAFGNDKNSNGTAAQHENGLANPIALDGEFIVPKGSWTFDDTTNFFDVKPVKTNAFKPKRVKMEFDPTAYDHVADVRFNAKGQENLYFAGHKFNKHGKINANGEQRYQCTKQASRKCLAAARTLMVDGILKMRILVAEHLHE